MTSPLDMSFVRTRLAARAAELAVVLLGEPTAACRADGAAVRTARVARGGDSRPRSDCGGAMKPAPAATCLR